MFKQFQENILTWIRRQWNRIPPPLRDRARWHRLIWSIVALWLMGWALHFTLGAWVAVLWSATLLYWLFWPRTTFAIGLGAIFTTAVLLVLKQPDALIRPLVVFGIATLLGVITFTRVPVIPKAWRWCWQYATRVSEDEFDVQEHRWRQVFFLVFIVVVALLGVRLDYVEVVAWIILVGGILFRWDHRIAATLAMGFLISCPFLLIAKKDAIAELMAIYAYYFLVVTTIQLIASSRRDDGEIENGELIIDNGAKGT